MSVLTDNAQLDKEKAEQLIASIPLMPELERIEVDPYTDHTGEPSLLLTFRMRAGVTVDQVFLDYFQAFKAVVQTRILHSDLNRFPYTRLKQVV